MKADQYRELADKEVRKASQSPGLLHVGEFDRAIRLASTYAQLEMNERLADIQKTLQLHLR